MNFGIGGPLGKFFSLSRRFYGYGDDIWKADAFIFNYKKFIKAGLDEELAVSRAAHEVVKYFPMFGDTNEFTKMIRQYVPFSSFTFEAIRVWNNAMTYKPHLALAWLHSAEMASSISAWSMGMSEDDLRNITDGLPGYTRGMKGIVMPYRSPEGEVRVLDWSTFLPLGSIPANVTKGEGTFFGVPPELNIFAGFGLTRNPVISTAIAATTGKDVFSGRDVEPTLMKRMGVKFDSEMGHKFFGLTEHMAQMILPPVVPPGFAGMNLLEAATGTVDPRTMEPMEKSVMDTIATNLLGFRTHKTSEYGAQQRIRFERDKQSREKSRYKEDYLFWQAQPGGEAKAAFALQRLQSFYESRAAMFKDIRKTNKTIAAGLSKKDVQKAKETVQNTGGHIYSIDLRSKRETQFQKAQEALTELEEENEQ
jgi:hypothetical protein